MANIGALGGRVSKPLSVYGKENSRGFLWLRPAKPRKPTYASDKLEAAFAAAMATRPALGATGRQQPLPETSSTQAGAAFSTPCLHLLGQLQQRAPKVAQAPTGREPGSEGTRRIDTKRRSGVYAFCIDYPHNCE
eukprot:scaffold1382_cov429-Prasinococcus_capsulatus_cf.AAC.6